MVSLAALVEDLKTLRKGRGVFAANILRRVGPALRAACELTEDDEAGHVRRKVTTTLETFAAALPHDLHTAVMAGFGLYPEARFPRYEDRVDWVARKLGHLPRTARRRIDEGVQHVAELIYESLVRAEHAMAATGWHTADLRVLAELDREQPQVKEQRRVIADRHDLTELDLALTLAPNLRDLEIEVVQGGTMKGRRMESSDRLGFTLDLPTPLARGESHVVVCQYRFTNRLPYVACVPRYPCDMFDLRVRFGVEQPPSRVLLLNGSFQRDVDDDLSPGKEMTLDFAGEVHVNFRDLSPGLAYGLRWH
jgi:hypothetical protein